jgi:cytosine/adenosine deaminase-related metal-dependent hydrolase
MQFKKYRAAQLFDGHALRGSEDVLITDAEGKVETILPVAEAGDDVQVLDGILSPGLINCHCHLELSHLKNVIPPHTGLIEFLCSVVTKRGFEQELIQEEIRKANAEMEANGIVAVGDICNTADAVTTKQKSRIRWHSFVEVLSFTDARAEQNMIQYGKVLKEHEAALRLPHASNLSPHAPYSISPLSFDLLNSVTANQTISIHNQEHPAEDELYKTGAGGFLRLYQIFGVEQSPMPVTGKSSLRSWLPHFNKGQKIFLVHNTYTPEEDIHFARNYAAEYGLELVFCFCPNANLYIESKLPDFSLFDNGPQLRVLGTDSYSSNWQLSIAKEIQAICQHSPAVPAETLLQWATLNGARALGYEADLGSFEKGKQPGLCLIAPDFSASQKIL